MANQTLINLPGQPWTIQAADSASGVSSSHFQPGFQVDITGTSFRVTNPATGIGILEVQGADFTMGIDDLTATYEFTATDGTPISGVVQCIPGSKSSAIIGGTTKDDPNTVAVWGGDDGQ